MKQLLYIGCNGHVAAIDPDHGHEIWRRKLLPGVFSSTNAQDVCVLDHDGKVFAGANGHLFCLDGRNGEILWHNELSGLGYNDVTLTVAGKAIQIVATVRQGNRNT